MSAVTRRTKLAIAAIAIAAALGFAAGGLSQLTAVSITDPRPSTFVPPSFAPAATPTPTPEPSPSQTPTPAPTPETALWRYSVIEGDSISGIAISWGTTTEEILALNPEYADNENLIEAGAQLILPCTPLADAEQHC